MCGEEWSLDGTQLKEVVDEVSRRGCPKHCGCGVIYLTHHEDVDAVPLQQFIHHGIAAVERF